MSIDALPIWANCGECRFWQRHSLEPHPEGYCRRNAPVLTLAHRWPSTTAIEVCGEFSPSSPEDTALAARIEAEMGRTGPGPIGDEEPAPKQPVSGHHRNLRLVGNARHVAGKIVRLPILGRIS